MKNRILQRWTRIGIVQAIVSLGLAALAPHLINSRFPIVGFLIWLVILGAMAISIAQVLRSILRARDCHRRFIQQFPDQPLNMLEFLGIPPQHLEDRLQQYALAEGDADFQRLEISPLAFIRGGL